MNSQTYRIEISHPDLGQHRVIVGRDLHVVQSKALEQMRRWDLQWEKLQERQRRELVRTEKLAHAEGMIEDARNMTEEAASLREEIQNVLRHTLSVDDRIDWNSIYDHSEFSGPSVSKPRYCSYEKEPKDSLVEVKLKLIERLLPALKRKKVAELERQHKAAMQKWRASVDEVERMNKEIHERYEHALIMHESDRESFYRQRDLRNQAIERQAAAYFAKNAAAVVEYCDLVLSKSEYPSVFPKEWKLEYIDETSILVVEYELPTPDVIPRLKEAKYVKAKDLIAETLLPEAKINEIYDDLLYQIALRTIHEIFESDGVCAVKMVVFNGFVSAIDVSTGNVVRTCVLSVQALKEEFMAINLANVIPRECFKKLKGVGSSKLHGMAPVAPILQIERSDDRIVEAYSVIDGVDSSVNLAAMDWEDFEHLIREVFAAEFSWQGGEVHVTKASRDGGVDAIAFDPDPIRGGKIVIQAKRYVGAVDVSAVRDLYGTVLNEGAIKGILVTTSNYGPDSYKFAKDKPISLLNGSNLLHLLEKHGRRARIDLRDAKQQLAEKGPKTGRERG
jgi:restriction system protein